MSHLSNNMEAARDNDPKRTWATDKIRALLVKVNRPLSVHEIARRCGLTLEQTKAVTSKLVAYTGGIQKVRGANGVIFYETFKTKPKSDQAPDPERPFRYAQPIRIGRGMKWGAGLV